jgi:hypothetical protein
MKCLANRSNGQKIAKSADAGRGQATNPRHARLWQELIQHLLIASCDPQRRLETIELDI